MSEHQLIVGKWSHVFPISCCVLTDSSGVNYCCDHAPLPPIPRWRGAYWRWRERWWALRLRFGSWIAGRDLDGDE